MRKILITLVLFAVGCADTVEPQPVQRCDNQKADGSTNRQCAIECRNYPLFPSIVRGSCNHATSSQDLTSQSACIGATASWFTDVSGDQRFGCCKDSGAAFFSPGGIVVPENEVHFFECDESERPTPE